MKHALVLSFLLVASPALAGSCFLNRGVMHCDDGQVGIVAPAYPTYGRSQGLSMMTPDDDEPSQGDSRPSCMKLTGKTDDTVDLTGMNDCRR